MEAAGTSDTSVNFYQTTCRSNPEESQHHTRRREDIRPDREMCFSHTCSEERDLLDTEHRDSKTALGEILCLSSRPCRFCCPPTDRTVERNSQLHSKARRYTSGSPIRLRGVVFRFNDNLDIHFVKYSSYRKIHQIKVFCALSYVSVLFL
jgi:hypothetical protein